VKQATSRSERAGERAITRYAALGDSFTAGTGDGAGAWPDELAATLGAANPALEYHNLGVIGASSAQVAEQLEAALALDPDFVTLVCGANDVLLSVRPNIARYESALAAMFARLRAAAPDTIVITATTPDPAQFLALRPRSRERVASGMRELNEVTRIVAARAGVLCLEFAEDPLAGERQNFAGDGYHASRDGNRRAAAAVASALRDHFGVRVASDGEPQ